jgi:hypothetical protein
LVGFTNPAGTQLIPFHAKTVLSARISWSFEEIVNASPPMVALSVVPTGSGHGPPAPLWVAGPKPPEFAPVRLPLMAAPQSSELNGVSSGEQPMLAKTADVPEATEQAAVLA